MNRTIIEDDQGTVAVLEPSDSELEALRFLVAGRVNVRSGRVSSAA